MTVTSAVVGATTPSSATVVAKVTDGPVSVEVDTDPNMTSAITFGPISVDADGVARVPISGLGADTKYYHRVLDNGATDLTIGSFHTHPPLGEPSDFTIAAASCAGASPVVPGEGAVLASNKLSNHTVFDTIAGTEPLMFLHMGDLHYYDLGAEPSSVAPGTLANYRRSYDDVLLQPRQANLYRSVAWNYVWDDHDYGPNNSDRTLPTKDNAHTAYRERVPHYPLPGGSGPIYQSWTIGRILFIASDVRTERSPNDDPDGPNKSMLGEAQKAWMRGVLENSDAAFLCWITPSVWHHVTNGIDTWMQFRTEQFEMIDMFTETGWIDRMLAVWGDRHVLGIDDGTNTPGGIPGFQYAGLDSSPSGVVSGLFSTGDASAQRGQWGTLRFRDTGFAVEVTGVGYVGSTVNRSLTFTVQAATEPGEPGEPGRPDVGVATRKLSVTWLGCDLVSGRIIAELPEMRGTVSRVLGAYTSVSLTLPIPHGGPGSFSQGGQSLAHVWEQATVPGQTMIVPVVNDVPAAAFIVLQRSGGNTSAELALACVSLEGYLERRYVRDHTLIDVDEAAVFTALVGDANIEGLDLIVDAPQTGTRRTRAYIGRDDATVYQRLEELMAVQGGPEWTIDVDWANDTRRAITKIARMRKRIGELRLDAVFSTEGAANVEYTFTEDYTDGKGANHIVATSSGEGEDRPESAPIDDVLFGWPRYERRFSPSSSIKSLGVLNEHAASELALRRDGARTWELSKPWDAYPRLGIDWKLGDSLPLELTGARHPFGVETTVRTIGWELDMQAGTVRPILLEVD